MDKTAESTTFVFTTLRWKPNIFISAHQPYSGCQRNVFVILNPFSGKGKALELWQREVAPIWHQAGFRMEIVVTTKAGHATEMARNLELRRIGLLAIGGFVIP